MERILFHNRHDKESRELLNSLGEGVRVIDVFGEDEIPEGYNLSVLPYLVDKELQYTGQNEYLFLLEVFPQTLTLSWDCVDYEGNPINVNDVVFSLTVNGATQQIKPVDGTISLDQECPEPCVIAIKVTNELDGYAIWQGTVTVNQVES